MKHFYRDIKEKLQWQSFVCLFLTAVSLGGCGTAFLKDPIEVDQTLPVGLLEEVGDSFAIEVEPNGKPSEKKAEISLPKSTKKESKARKIAKSGAVKIKDDVSFEYPNRRPENDPVWIGEKLRFEIGYFGMAAGTFDLQVLPYKRVRGRKVYHLQGLAQSNPMFSMFYRMKDIVESFVDYEGLFSHRFHLLLDESKQQRESVELYDSQKKQTYYWNKVKKTDTSEKEEKKFADIEPFSQDSLSALYYLRFLPFEENKVLTFPVVSEGKGWEAVITVLKREKKSTALGDLPVWKLKVETKFQGVLQKQGDSFLWIEDSPRRFPVRLEAKVKVGSVVVNLRKVVQGTAPEVANFSLEPTLLKSSKSTLNVLKPKDSVDFMEDPSSDIGALFSEE